MSWHRWLIGHVEANDLVHYLYEWSKGERVRWDTQCDIGWGTRNNTSLDYKPLVVGGLVTCLLCLDAESKIRRS